MLLISLIISGYLCIGQDDCQGVKEFSLDTVCYPLFCVMVLNKTKKGEFISFPDSGILNLNF